MQAPPAKELTLHELELLMIQVVKQLLQTAAYLHSRKIAHRNISLDTVLVSDTLISEFDVRVQLKNLSKAALLVSSHQRLFDDLEGLNFCAPEIFNKDVGHGMAVDVYAIGVVAFYMFGGMKDFPFKIPLSLTDDMRIYSHLVGQQLEFKQPVWGHYRHGRSLM